MDTNYYHGTNTEFCCFQGEQIFFGTEERYAEIFAQSKSRWNGGTARIVKAKLSIRNPFVYREGVAPFDDFTPYIHQPDISRSTLIGLGHDGIHRIDSSGREAFIVFSPDQIKIISSRTVTSS